MTNDNTNSETEGQKEARLNTLREFQRDMAYSIILSEPSFGEDANRAINRHFRSNPYTSEQISQVAPFLIDEEKVKKIGTGLEGSRENPDDKNFGGETAVTIKDRDILKYRSMSFQHALMNSSVNEIYSSMGLQCPDLEDYNKPLKDVSDELKAKVLGACQTYLVKSTLIKAHENDRDEAKKSLENIVNPQESGEASQ